MCNVAETFVFVDPDNVAYPASAKTPDNAVIEEESEEDNAGTVAAVTITMLCPKLVKKSPPFGKVPENCPKVLFPMCHTSLSEEPLWNLKR